MSVSFHVKFPETADFETKALIALVVLKNTSLKDTARNRSGWSCEDHRAKHQKCEKSCPNHAITKIFKNVTL